MSYQIHPQARTTPKIRAEIQASTLGVAQLAKKYNITIPTVQKWKSRDNITDLSHCAHHLNTTLTPAQEQIVVELRRTLLLAIEDLFVVTREFVNPEVSRSGLARCLVRHQVNNLNQLRAAQNPEAATDKKPIKTFKDYEPGFIHIDIKYLPKMPDEEQHRYLFVAIDRATRWVYTHIYDNQTEASSVDFLQRLIENCSFKIQKILTDNGTQFTDRFTSSEKQATGRHSFDQECTAQSIEHRLIPPRHPQTNGMVERFNGRISEVVKQTRFSSRDELEATLLAYVRVYNHHIPQKALKHHTPIYALKIWQQNKPDIFVKKVYDRAGLDISHSCNNHKQSRYNQCQLPSSEEKLQHELEKSQLTIEHLRQQLEDKQKIRD
jgi:transposase-like protein